MVSKSSALHKSYELLFVMQFDVAINGGVREAGWGWGLGRVDGLGVCRKRDGP